MKYGALVGWGIVIYAILFLVHSILVAYGQGTGMAPRVIALAALLITALVAGRSLRFRTWHDILPYSLCWTLVVMGIDVILSVPFAGWSMFADPNVWVGYALVTLAPLSAPYTRHAERIPEHG